MPQFHLANFAPQLAWLALFFAILYFGIVRLTLPKLGKTITAREDRIADDLSTAERAKSDADMMAATYAADIDEAHKAARGSVAEAKAKATASVEKALAIANAALADKAAAADAALAAARGTAMTEIENVAADAASAIIVRLTGKAPDTVLVANAAKSAMAV